MSRLRQVGQLLLRIEDSPDRIALAFGVGVFIAFFPVLGIHTAVALFVAFAFRLSRLAVLTGAWINNPWTIAPLYMAGTLLGCAILGVPSEGLSTLRFDLRGDAFYQSLWQGLRPYVLPYVVGNLVLGALCGVIAYVVLRAALLRRQPPPAPA